MLAALTCVALCIFVLVYRGPGRAFIRGSVGDIIAVALLFFALGWLTSWTRWVRAGAVLAVAFLIELSQLIPRSWRSDALEIVIGHTFDAHDLLWYSIGLVLAVLLDAVLPQRQPGG